MWGFKSDQQTDDPNKNFLDSLDGKYVVSQDHTQKVLDTIIGILTTLHDYLSLPTTNRSVNLVFGNEINEFHHPKTKNKKTVDRS